MSNSMPSSSHPVRTTIEPREEAFSLEEKAALKAALQRELGWKTDPKRALLCLPTGMSDELGGTLLQELLPGLLELPIHILILGKGSASYGALLTQAMEKHSDRIAIVPNAPANIERMYAASDMSLFLVHTRESTQYAQALSSSAVPIAPVNTTLEAYDPNGESGHAFLFAEATPWQCFAAIVRALETYRFPFDWRTIQKNGQESVY